MRAMGPPRSALVPMYLKGNGLPQDYDVAMTWFRKAADSGNALGQYNVGVLFHEGFGVVQNSTQAAKWYRLAADQGYLAAMFNLGLSYGSGEGVPEDDVTAQNGIARRPKADFPIPKLTWG